MKKTAKKAIGAHRRAAAKTFAERNPELLAALKTSAREQAAEFVTSQVSVTIGEWRDGSANRSSTVHGESVVHVRVDAPGTARTSRHDLRVALADLAQTLGNVFGDPIDSAEIFVLIRRERAR